MKSDRCRWPAPEQHAPTVAVAAGTQKDRTSPDSAIPTAPGADLTSTRRSRPRWREAAALTGATAFGVTAAVWVTLAATLKSAVTQNGIAHVNSDLDGYRGKRTDYISGR